MDKCRSVHRNLSAVDRYDAMYDRPFLKEFKGTFSNPEIRSDEGTASTISASVFSIDP